MEKDIQKYASKSYKLWHFTLKLQQKVTHFFHSAKQGKNMFCHLIAKDVFTLNTAFLAS